MKTYDVFGYSFSAIKLRKLRAALTTLGVIIGIAAIVALLSITQGLQVSITNDLNRGLSSTTLIVVPGSNALGAFGGTGFKVTPLLTPEVFVGSLAFGVGISVIFALYPAWRASRLKPVDALRYE